MSAINHALARAYLSRAWSDIALRLRNGGAGIIDLPMLTRDRRQVIMSRVDLSHVRRVRTAIRVRAALGRSPHSSGASS